MNKKPIIWSIIIIIIVLLVGGFLFINSKNKNSANIVSYYCQDGAFKAQFGENYVMLTFKDNTNILLPQATSGSGIRYEMGSTTFMGEGDNASLMENNVMMYTNCVAGKVAVNKDINTYTDTSKTFSFSYPNQFVLSGGDFGYSQNWTANSSNLGLLLAVVNIPRTFFAEKTNFGDAKFTVGTSVDPDAVKNCLKFAYENMGTTTEITINNRKFTRLNFTDVGAGNYYETTSYRTVYNNQCYAVEYTVHSSNIHNYSPDQGIVEFDKAKIASVLEGIAQSFKFI